MSNGLSKFTPLNGELNISLHHSHGNVNEDTEMEAVFPTLTHGVGAHWVGCGKTEIMRKMSPFLAINSSAAVREDRIQ